MRRMHLIAAVAVAVLALTGCGGPKESPEEVVKAASDASLRGDVDELERRLDAAMFAEILKAMGDDREQLRKQLLASAKEVRLKSYTVLDTSVEGDAATVDSEAVVTIVTQGQDVRARSRTHLKKDGSTWRLSGVEALGQPELVGPPGAKGLEQPASP